MTPPEHIKSNNIYSNVYRKAIAQGLSLERAKNRSRRATEVFKSTGQVRQDWVGSFRKPRS